MSKGATKQTGEPVDDPAVIHGLHVQNRPLYDEKTGRTIIGKAGWRNETQFERACRLGQLVCKERCKDDKSRDSEIEHALDRRDAGRAFVEAWDIRDRGNKDSTDLNRGGSAASAAGISDSQIDAANLLASWQRHMGANDWMLARRVCGENFAVSHAVAEISPSYRDSSLARFREALNSLILARIDARKCQWCRRNKPHGADLSEP